MLVTWVFLVVGMAIVGAYPTPSPEQLAWSQFEIGTMISFNMETSAYNVSDTGFCGFQTGEYFPDGSTFNPMFLNTDQWAQAMVAYGSNGYALWPTDVADYTYNIRQSPWMNGQGDVVQAFINSCKKAGIAPGLYYGVGNNFYLNIHNGQVQNASKLLPDIVIQQLTEIWSRYGQLAEIWFDGGTYSFSDRISDLLEKLQPQTIAFQGPEGFTNNIRWVGNEMADPPYPCWSTANNSNDYGGGNTDANAVWVPAESDTTIRWFWMSNYFSVGIKDVSTLFALYEAAVGRNTNFMLNLSPDPYGLVPIEDFIEYEQLGQLIQACYGKSINETQGEGNSVKLQFNSVVSINRIVISENQKYGQRIRAFQVQASQGSGYQTISTGSSIGNKRILALDPPIQASSLLLSISSSIDSPIIQKLAAYSC